MIGFFIRLLSDGCLVRHVANSGWLSVAAAAGRLGCSELTVRRWIRDGGLPACRPGHAYRVWGPDLDKFIRSRRVSPQHEVQRKLTPAQLRESRERGEMQLRALRELETLREQHDIDETARKLGLDPEVVLAAFADEYAHHQGPKTALFFALKGIGAPAWLSEHRAKMKLARRLGGAGDMGDPDLPEGFEAWPKAIQARFLEEYHALYFPKLA